jgi:hypothetical protein
MPPKTTARKQKKAPGDPPKKRGQPSDFKGARLEFLTEHIPEYIDYSTNKRDKDGKKIGTREFYDTFFPRYWRKFPWRLGLEEEPSDEPEQPPQNAEEAFKALDLELTPEEEAKKSKVQIETKKVRALRWRLQSSIELTVNVENQTLV